MASLKSLGKLWQPMGFRLHSVANLLHVSIHETPAKISVGERLYCRHCLAMFLQQVVWTVVDSKVAGDAFALDIGVVTVEVNRRVLEVLDGDAVAAKRAGTFRVGCL